MRKHVQLTTFTYSLFDQACNIEWNTMDLLNFDKEIKKTDHKIYFPPPPLIKQWTILLIVRARACSNSGACTFLPTISSFQFHINCKQLQIMYVCVRAYVYIQSIDKSNIGEYCKNMHK